MDKYIVMAEIVKQIVASPGLWIVPVSVLCWKLPDVVRAWFDHK